MSVGNVVSYGYSYTMAKAKKKELLAKSNGKCCHCGKELSPKDSIGIHDLIPYNAGNTQSMLSLAAVCEDCDKEVKGIAQNLEYYEYLSSESKDLINKEISKYNKTIDWYLENNIYPIGDVECEGVKLYNLSTSEFKEELTKFIEDYNTYIKLPLYGEENLVSKILKDGRFFCSRSEDGELELVIPIKPIKNPQGYILNVGNIMINPKIELGDEKLKVFNKVITKFIKILTSHKGDSMLLDIVLACNSKDNRIVPMVKNRNSINYKVNTIRPGYSLAQAVFELPNLSFIEELKGISKFEDYKKDKSNKVKEFIKKAKKSFSKLMKLYISSEGGTNYEAYINSRKSEE